LPALRLDPVRFDPVRAALPPRPAALRPPISRAAAERFPPDVRRRPAVPRVIAVRAVLPIDPVARRRLSAAVRPLLDAEPAVAIDATARVACEPRAAAVRVAPPSASPTISAERSTSVAA
jgi:hypothetical protein